MTNESDEAATRLQWIFCLTCFGLALINTCFGVVDAKHAVWIPVNMVGHWFQSIVTAHNNAWTSAMSNNRIFSILFYLLLWVPLAILTLIMVIIAVPVEILAWLGRHWQTMAFIEQLFYANLLAFPLGYVLLLVVRPFLPMGIVSANDLLFLVPNRLRQRLQRNESATVRIRSIQDLYIAMLSAVIALVAFAIGGWR